MARIKGTTVTLYQEKLEGYNNFKEPIYIDDPVEVENVLIGEPSTDEVLSSTSLYGKKISYMLAIPKGDDHDWVDKKVSWTDSYGIEHTVMTFGYPITGIEENIPAACPWHMKMRCEAYDQGNN